MRSDLEASGFGVFSPQEEKRLSNVEESVLSKLSRYESAIERQLYRALHQLEQFSKRMVLLVETRKVLSLLYSLNAEGSFLGKVHPFRERL